MHDDVILEVEMDVDVDVRVGVGVGVLEHNPSDAQVAAFKQHWD